VEKNLKKIGEVKGIAIIYEETISNRRKRYLYKDIRADSVTKGLLFDRIPTRQLKKKI
jgi:hypothetical protein